MSHKRKAPHPEGQVSDVGRCPCGSGRAFDECCGPYLAGSARPQTAEALMRSRYTAYSLRREDYLFRTWHPATCPENLELDAQPMPRWLGLTIVALEAGQPADSEGLVEFVARYKRGGKATRLHERSYFKQIDGRWLYVGADIEQR